MPFSRLLDHCDCRHKLDREGFHLITSIYEGGHVWSHDTIVAKWFGCLKELGTPHQTEPRNRYVQTDGRPDITFYDIDSGVTYECDVSLAHPWRKDIVHGACKGMQTCSDKRKSEKCYKYSKEILTDGTIALRLFR